MHALNHTLERILLQADGRYLNIQELEVVERYVQTYATRLQTYEQLREHGDKLVVAALRKLMQVQPELVQQHGPRCKYDLTEVLRYIALAVLRDDETFFREQLLFWLDTVLLAHGRTENCVIVYRSLKDAVAKALPAANAQLIHPYLDSVIQSLGSHARS